RPGSRRTSAAMADGCAARQRSGSATSTPRPKSPTAQRPPSSLGSGLELSPAQIQPAQAPCPWFVLSGLVRRAAENATSSPPLTASESGSKSAGLTAPPGRERLAGLVQPACFAAHPCHWDTYVPKAKQAGSARSSWLSRPKAIGGGT